MGRPSLYTPELIEAIAARLSTGETLSSICRDDGMPDRSTIWDWQQKNPDVSQRLARARDIGEEAILEETLHISDDGRRDYTVGEDGSAVVNHDHIQRAKLRVDTRLKLLAIWNPKKYGNKVDVNHGGQKGNPFIALLSEISGTSLQPKDSVDDDG